MTSLLTPFLVRRFWANIEKMESCWLWKGGHNTDGYAEITINRRPYGAHRFAYELINGSIPNGLTIDHLCRNPGCVNPEHLEAVTMNENLKRSPIQVTTINAKKTHCPKGHLLKEGNLVIWLLKRYGWRNCLTCKRIQM